jgi:hypothetical protein
MAANNTTQSLFSGARAGRNNSRVPQFDSGVYKPLFRVVFRHTFNNDTRRRCPNFQVVPSPTSAALMRAQGMVFQDNGTGFSVYIRESQIGDLVAYLRRQASGKKPDQQYWSWLSFVLVSQDPLFVGITKVPIDTNPLFENLYGTNRDAHGPDAVKLLASGLAMDGEDLHEITPAQFAVSVPLPFYQAVVRDISGRIVLVSPSDDLWKHLWESRGTSEISLGASGHYYVQVDLSTLPLGLYTLGLRSGPHQPDQPIWPNPRLYTEARPGPPLAFLDMLFTQPYRGAPGVYPVPPLFGDEPIDPTEVGDVTYELRFDARETWWQYYIVCQTPESELLDLKVFGKDATFTQATKPVILPSGQLATLFQSDKTLGLREIPPQRFALTGTRRDKRGKLSPIRVDPLPAAPIAPVWPVGDGFNPDGPDLSNGTSEMFVYV